MGGGGEEVGGGEHIDRQTDRLTSRQTHRLT